MTKVFKKAAVLLMIVCLCTCLFGFSTSAAGIGDPVWSANVEGYQPDQENPLGTTGFYYPFAGGDMFLKVADASDPVSADYVIEGNYSMYFMNVGDEAAGDMSPMITDTPKDSPQDFKADKTYIARFLMKQIAPFGNEKSYLNVTVRTWTWGDAWVNFKFFDDGEGGLDVDCNEGAKMFEKGAVQKVGEDLYEVALRFNGVSMENVTNNYLFWYLFGEGGFAIDDLKIYESASNPTNAFELEPLNEGGNTDGGNTDGGNTDGGNTDGGNTDGGNTDGGNTDGGNTDGGNTDGGDTTTTTTKAPAGNTNNTTKAPATDDAGDDADDQDAAGGLSAPALIALIVAGVVVLGAAAFIVVIVIRRKKGDIAE